MYLYGGGNMKEKLLCIFVCLLLSLSFIGTISSATIQKKSMDPEPIADYSHYVFGEYFTLTTCVPCKYSHTALKELYAEGWHPFYYITYVSDVNNNSRQRKNELNVFGSPTEVWDGGYKYNIGGSGSTEEEKTKFNYSIIQCGARDVWDIDLDLNVTWLGAVNNHPEDGETVVPIEVVLNWTISEMKIDVDVTNNEASDYDGHVHVQVTEVESVWYNDKFDKPYTFEFKSYAYNDDVPINASDTWSETIYYDGCDHNDADDPPNYFDHITEDNIQVIAIAMDKDNDKYVDETAGFRVGVDTDPKTFNVYFGDSYPPPLVITNGSAMKYNPFEDLNWTTDYYWKIDVWNNLSELTPGDEWNFTTRGNSPPYPPTPKYPQNGSGHAPIDTILEWYGGDPDGDDVTYDVYFGEFSPFEGPPLVANNITNTSYDPTPFGQTLEFNTKYAWKIVAWDEYGLNASGGPWCFTTQPNYPPDPAHDPIPLDGAKNVSVNASLYWNGSDPNSGDILTYDVYFGPNPDPPLVESNQPENYYDPYGENDMPIFLDFYWRIETRDMEGELTPGPNWTFATGLNPKPTPPEIDGPTRGKKQIPYNFTFVSTDPDNQKIRYHVDWDDDIIIITDYYESGEVVTLNHTWEEDGKYIIEARAEDWYKAKSELSTHAINIPRGRMSRYSLFLELLEHILDSSPLLRYILGV